MINLSVNGRLTRDPVFSEYTNRDTGVVTPVARFTVACSTPHNGTKFVSCTCWGALTKSARYLKKGRMIFASGMPSAYHRASEGTIYDNLALSVLQLEFLDANPDNRVKEPKPQDQNLPVPEPLPNVSPEEEDPMYAFSEENLPL